MSTHTESGLEDATRALLEYYNQAETLARIEGVLWLIAALLAVIAILLYFGMKKISAATSERKGGWQVEVERAYNKADYKTALNILETTRLLSPGLAAATYWRGRCYFQMQEWEKAATTFEDLIRHEPIYRNSIKDYMSFIELNELVPDVEGYLSKDD